MAFEINDIDLQGEAIRCLGAYRPYGYHKVETPDAPYPHHSRLILDLKDKKPVAIRYFAEQIAALIRGPAVVVTVPSHDPDNVPNGVALLAVKLAETTSWEDGSGCIVRHTKVEKRANAGDRSVASQTGSTRVERRDLVVGKTVVLLDDVTTTGNSLLAGKRMLIDAGAAAVYCLALGRTTY